MTEDLKKHREEVNKDLAYSCDQCGLQANKTKDLKKHREDVQKDPVYS